MNKQRGFTLIELLVVIAIIGTLATVILASLDGARSKARDSKRLSDIKEIQKALELAFDNDGQYPITDWECSYQAGWQTGDLATALAPYMQSLPVDPENETGGQSYTGYKNYCYYSNNYPSGTPSGSGKWYMLVLNLENTNTSLENTDGVTACDDQSFDYGGATNLTIGADCYNFSIFD